MKRVDFDLGTTAAAAQVSRRAVEAAERIMEKHRSALQAVGVIGMWIGAKARRPYIMLAVTPSGSAKLQQSIPDSIEGINVYYLEGTST
jgi:hypothetical protein